MKRKNQFAFILGPHRSGSSLLAAGLHSLGVNLGNQFIAPNEDNPKGFFEDEEIVRLNDRLLRSMNLSWDSFGFIWEQDFAAERLRPYHNAAVAMVLERFNGVRVAGLKDPRFCILLPFWKRVISEALDADIAYVVSIREPDQCLRSQKARHNKDSDFHLLGRRNVQTLLLWLTYIHRALAEMEPERLIIVNYATLIQAAESEIQRLAKFLELDCSRTDVESFCRDHVDPLLNRSTKQGVIRRAENSRLWLCVDTLYEHLLAFSSCDAILPEAFASARNSLDMQELQPVYLKELQYMNGYSYKKIISLRHRLIQTIEEINSERGNLAVLRDKYNTLDEQHLSLVKEHEQLSLAHQTVLNTRGWKLLMVIRRFISWMHR